MGQIRWRKGLGAVLGLAIVLVAVAPAVADDRLLQELKERLDRLEKQNEELRRKLLHTGQGGPYKPDTRQADQEKDKLNQAIDSYLKEKDKQKKQADESKAKQKEQDGYEVGKQLGLQARWNHGLWLESEDKAFRVHVGGRTQIDTAFVHAPRNMQVPLSQGGIGEYDDGVNFRRARFAIEGTFWEVFDFNCEYDFLNVFRFVPAGEVLPGNVAGIGNNRTLSNTGGSVVDRQNVANTPVPTDLWMQWSQIPFIGHIRIGNQKPWYSFEHITSSRFLDFLERSYAFDSFVENGNNGFTFGVSAWNNFLDERLGLAAGVYKVNTVDIFGWNVGDGEYQFVSRVWGTPIYQEHGRCLVHLGVGYTHRGADDGRIRYRSRPMIRNGNAVLHNTVAIIQANASDENILVPEIAINYGPFSLSAEYYLAWANIDRATNVAGQGTLPASLVDAGQVFYQGGYITLGYFLTGEHRSYNRVTGAWDRQAVHEAAWFVDGEDGLCIGRGAWQVLARYSWLDLNDKGLNGGVIHSATLGLNWFLNPNAKLQFNYELAHRDVTQYTATGVAPGGLTIRDGLIQGFGTRLAFDF